MYEEFFGLKSKPFSLLPDPDFLFLSEKHALALSLLEYSLSGQAGFCVITGEIGSGKTTLVRAFLKRVGRDFTIGLISNTHGSLHDIAGWALTAFGRKPSGNTAAETYQDLMGYLIEEYGAGRQCILVVDEAQNLSIESLEELRLLSNINSGRDLLLQIVLVGQPELLAKLRRPELSQFAQRIAVSHHLAPLPFAETRRYIEHRLKVAGTDREVFTEMAMGAVQYFSGGVPRLINSICDLSLVYGFADGQRTITEDIVFSVVKDRQDSGIAPFATTQSADDPSVRGAVSTLARSGREAWLVPDAPSNRPTGESSSVPSAPSHRSVRELSSLPNEPSPRSFQEPLSPLDEPLPGPEQESSSVPREPSFRAVQESARVPNEPPRQRVEVSVREEIRRGLGDTHHYGASDTSKDVEVILTPSSIGKTREFGPAANAGRKARDEFFPQQDDLLLSDVVYQSNAAGPIGSGASFQPETRMEDVANQRSGPLLDPLPRDLQSTWTSTNGPASNPWPSVNERGQTVAKKSSAEVRQQSGTIDPPRRSWWRRGRTGGN